MFKKQNSNFIWHTALYLRLSKEDEDTKEVSNSILNQKDLILRYIKSFSDVEYVDSYIDDGYTGFNFDRPGFERMMKDIESGLINCVIVKDLSRFGRNWTQTGRYIDQIFPSMKVRFIAVNDNVDTLKKTTGSERIIIPFRNLMNEGYIRDISEKTTSVLLDKCKEGQFIGAFAPYGYRKDPLNHNRLVVDEEAAKTVRQIFELKLEGYSPQLIADTLNNQGVSSPTNYKNDNGENYSTPFQIHSYTKWSAKSVYRILKNEVYTGTLIQGKTGKINFKIGKRITKHPEKWMRVMNTHKAIISEHTFSLVNELMEQDTRQSPIRKGLYIFSGLICCADCGSSMVRKTVTSKGKKYYYFVCSGYKGDKNSCSSHSISENNLQNAVLKALNLQASCVVEVAKILETIDTAPLRRLDMQRLQQGMKHNNSEIEKYQKRLSRLYEDLQDKLINHEEYSQFKDSFHKKIARLIGENISLQNDIDTIDGGNFQEKNWLMLFKDKTECNCLDRISVIHLIDKIIVHENAKIKILFKFQSEFDAVSAFIQNIQREA